VLPFDTDAAHAGSAVTAKTGGREFPTPDGYIGAIAASRSFVVVSCDIAPFEVAARPQIVEKMKEGKGACCIQGGRSGLTANPGESGLTHSAYFRLISLLDAPDQAFGSGGWEK